MKALALGVVLTALAVPAAAQDIDPRWTGWLGCWELITDDERAAAPAPAAAAIDRALGFDRPLPAPRADARDPSTPRVCVTREGEGVSITTYQGETVILQQAIVADGRTQAVGGICPGTRRAEWSDGRPHLLSHAEFTCAADARSHAGAALALITADGTWLDIETVRTGGHEALRVRRYQPLRDDTGSRVVPGAPLTLADVQALSTRLPAPIVEAAIVESRAVLPVGAKDVVALADRGVPERVIDLLVALAYPQTFVVERRAVAAPASFGAGDLSSADAWRYYAPMAFSMPGFYAHPDFYFFRATPGALILDGGSGWVGGGSVVAVAPPPATATGSPQVINDLGYTRVRPREVDTPTPQRRPVSSSTGGVVTGPSTAATSPGSSGGASDGGGGGATASPGGYSSGGGSDTGRTAVPR